MRYLPDSQYEDFPCSYVAAGCAYEAVTKIIARESPRLKPWDESAGAWTKGKQYAI